MYLVIPAQAGIPLTSDNEPQSGIPACAGMTDIEVCCYTSKLHHT